MSRGNILKKFCLFIIFLSNTLLIVGIELKLEKKIRLKEDKTTILSYISQFTINKNKEIIVPDGKMSEVKVFSSNGDLKYTIGRKGQGPGEFITPYSCFSNDNDLWISDLRGYKISKFIAKNNVYIYKEFIRISGFCTDIKVKDNVIFIAGYITGNQGAYALYSKDLKNPRKTEYLLPNELKYGYTSDKKKQFLNDWKGRKNFSSFDPSGYFDIYKNDIYFIWPGDLRIIKINIKDKSTKIFGHKTNNYIKPFVSRELIEANRNRDSAAIRELRKNMSYVGGVFVTTKFIGLIYRGKFDNSLDGGPVFIQFYTHGGKFLEEFRIKDVIGNVYLDRTFYYSRDKSKLYFLNRKETQDNENDYIYEILVFGL